MSRLCYPFKRTQGDALCYVLIIALFLFLDLLLSAPVDDETLGFGILLDALQRVPLVVGSGCGCCCADTRRHASVGNEREAGDEGIVVAQGLAADADIAALVELNARRHDDGAGRGGVDEEHLVECLVGLRLVAHLGVDAVQLLLHPGVAHGGKASGLDGIDEGSLDGVMMLNEASSLCAIAVRVGKLLADGLGGPCLPNVRMIPTGARDTCGEQSCYEIEHPIAKD